VNVTRVVFLVTKHHLRYFPLFAGFSSQVLLCVVRLLLPVNKLVTLHLLSTAVNMTQDE